MSFGITTRPSSADHGVVSPRSATSSTSTPSPRATEAARCCATSRWASAGDRIGVVGADGDGRSTLLRLIAGAEQPDAGLVTRAGDLDLALLGQGDELAEQRTIREELVEGGPTTSGPATIVRTVLAGLLGGVELASLPRRARRGRRVAVGRRAPRHRTGASAARRSRAAPPRRADQPPRCRGSELAGRSSGRAAGLDASGSPTTAGLDAVCTATWEVADGAIHRYEGGYAAYVLARAERDRQEGAQDDRRRQLRAQGAGLAAARAAGAHREAEVPASRPPTP